MQTPHIATQPAHFGRGIADDSRLIDDDAGLLSVVQLPALGEYLDLTAFKDELIFMSHHRAAPKDLRRDAVRVMALA